MLEVMRSDAVVLLVADTDEVVARLLKRAEIEGRGRRHRSMIRHRQTFTRSRRHPDRSLFTDRGILVRSTVSVIDEVAGRIASALDAKLGKQLESIRGVRVGRGLPVSFNLAAAHAVARLFGGVCQAGSHLPRRLPRWRKPSGHHLHSSSTRLREQAIRDAGGEPNS